MNYICDTYLKIIKDAHFGAIHDSLHHDHMSFECIWCMEVDTALTMILPQFQRLKHDDADQYMILVLVSKGYGQFDIKNGLESSKHQMRCCMSNLAAWSDVDIFGWMHKKRKKS